MLEEPATFDIVLSHVQVAPLLQAHKDGKDHATVSPDLGLTKVVAQIGEEAVEFPTGERLSWGDAKTVVKEERKCFLLLDNELKDIRAYSEATGWVRSLSPTTGAPTMLVSGIPMHRIKDTEPMKDTQAKIKAIGELRGEVLDTATGLGYTAIEAARSAKQVTTVELDPAAIEIARHNPWSRRLFDNPRINIVIGDVFDEVQSMPAGHFSAVIHDPPTIQFAGDLYSGEFYAELHRVLRRGGKLFHYVGDPKSALGSKTTTGVLKRLSDVGFKKIERHPEAFGLTAIG
jgi:uncharacterized protein